MIQAVILAGGLGTRMRPFTETLPKALLPVLGRPFLEYQIELLEANGITRFLLLVSYLGHLIEEHFGSSHRRAQIVYSYETSPLGTGGALKNAAAALLEDDFLVVNGDTLLDIDYRAFAAAFRTSGAEAMVAAYRNIAQNVPSNLAIDENGLVLDYQKTRPAGEHVDAGVLALKKSVLSLVQPNRKCSLEEVFPQLIQSGQLLAWPTEQAFYDMGTPAGLQMLEAHISRNARAQ